MSLSVYSSTQDIAFPASLSPYIGAVLLESFLYGLYVILFAICAYVLLSRHKRLHWILLVSATTMFALATSDIVYTYRILFGKLMKGSVTLADVRLKYWLYITNNVIADSLLLYRCWVVWEFRKLVMLGPVILLLVSTACGYVFVSSTSGLVDKAWIYLIMTLILNVILTALTAGRIWWLERNAKLILGSELLRRYNATIAILIESGLLYSLYIILDLGFQKHKTLSVILNAGLIQVVGIVPTLIIVEVGLGRAVHDIEANEAIARLEGNSNKIPPTSCSLSGGIHCERRHALSLTNISGRSNEISPDIRIAAEMEHEIGVEGLRQLRGESLRLSWEFGIGASSHQELDVLQQVPGTI